MGNTSRDEDFLSNVGGPGAAGQVQICNHTTGLEQWLRAVDILPKTWVLLLSIRSRGSGALFCLL